MEQRPVIETRDLVKRFADVEAVAGIDLRVPPGGVYGFLGPNGAGKSTTIRILTGLLRPTRGTGWLLGEVATPGAPVLGRIGALVERPAFYPYLSATDNLRAVGHARSVPLAVLDDRVSEALERVGLTTVARRKAGGFSTGMRQRLGIAAALLGRPELVILDEPTNGLDPNGVVDVRRLIASLAGDGITVFLSSHVLPEVEQLCNRVAILHGGRIVAEGATQEMLRQGERVLVRFDSLEEATRGRDLLAAAEVGDVTVAGPTELLVDAPPGRGSDIARALGRGDVFPAELSVRRQSLEAVFIELTRGQDARPEGGSPGEAPNS